MLLREQGNALAGRHVPVTKDDMGVGVVGVLAPVMDGGQPRHPAAPDLPDKLPHEVGPLLRGKLKRQGHHDLVDDAGVFAVGLSPPGQAMPGPSGSRSACAAR